MLDGRNSHNLTLLLLGVKAIKNYIYIYIYIYIWQDLSKIVQIDI